MTLFSLAWVPWNILRLIHVIWMDGYWIFISASTNKIPGGLITTLSTFPRPPSLSLSSESGENIDHLWIFIFIALYVCRICGTHPLTCDIDHSGHTHRPVLPHFHFDLLQEVSEVHVWMWKRKGILIPLDKYGWLGELVRDKTSLNVRKKVIFQSSSWN